MNREQRELAARRSAEAERELRAAQAGLRADDSDEARQRYARAREAYAAAEAEGLRLLGIGAA